MRVLRLCLFLGFLSFGVASSVGAQETTASAAEEQIRQQVVAYQQAFNAADLEKLATLWTEQGEYHNSSTGEKTTGRERILADLEIFFSENPQTQLFLEVSEIKLITPAVARVQGYSQVVYGPGEIHRNAYQSLYVLSENVWQLESITETDLPQLTPQQALQKLAWLVGTWEDESTDLQVTVQCRWGKSNAFLIRSFSVQNAAGELSQGTQIIGWDALLQQIRSWSFHSDGSFSHGFWSQNGDTWVVRSTQTLPSGQTSEALYVMSDLLPNEMTVRLASQAINGELQPSRPAVKVRRILTEILENPEKVSPPAGATPAEPSETTPQQSTQPESRGADNE